MKGTGYKTWIEGKWQIDDFRLKPDALVKNTDKIAGQLVKVLEQENFEELVSLIDEFPEYDNNPICRENPMEEWDLMITAKSEVWNK